MLRTQLRLFYRVYPLNSFKKEDKIFQEILDKPLGEGRAKCIEKSDFPKEQFDKTVGDLIINNPRFKSALEILNTYPLPDDFSRVFIIIGGIIYSEEEITESMLKELKTSLNVIKMGRLNNGFTFFDDRNYSIRFIIKDRAIQGIELFVHKSDKIPLLRIKTPLIPEEHLNRKGDIKDLIQAFQISDSLSDVESSEKESQN
jgi:hypothetical protein